MTDSNTPKRRVNRGRYKVKPDRKHPLLRVIAPNGTQVLLLDQDEAMDIERGIREWLAARDYDAAMATGGPV